MKTTKIGVLFLALLVGMAGIVTPTMAATEEEITQSIDAGLAWLATKQQVGGSWNSDPGITGLVLLKFIEYANEQKIDPEGPDYLYNGNVKAGLTYLNGQLSNVSTGTGYDGNGNTIMRKLGGTYYTGIATMVYSALGKDPDLIQDLTDWLVNAQCTDSAQPQYGVWSYGGFSCSGDNSNTGYATMGIGFALNAGASIPGGTKTALDSYVDYIQNDPGAGDNGGEDDPDGGSGYVVANSWVNSLKTGNLIFEAGLSGDDSGSTRITNATDYINRHWNDTIEGWKGNLPNYNTQYQATFTIMKGLEAIGLEKLNGKDWFGEMSTVIVDDQKVDGNWTGCPAYVWIDGTPGGYMPPDELCSAWALLTLEKVTIEFSVPGFMTGGGSVFTENGKKVTHGFELNCDKTQTPNNLEVNWGKGNKFHLETLDSAYCFDDSKIVPNPPPAGFDTYKGTGTGRYNGVAGATAEWTFTDAGEPGKEDTAKIQIDVNGNTVLTVSGKLQNGNQQAHKSK